MKTTTTYKIDKDVPLPKPRGQLSAIIKMLKKGDSFLVPGPSQRLSSYIFAKKLGIKICSHAENGQIRIWRVE